jgi:hypothetical protein
MEIEQTRPNKPNFLAVVLLACAAILVIFVLAYLFVDHEGGHLNLRHHRGHPTSQLALPASPTTLA